MQAAPDVSPWPKRLLIAGIAMSAIGLILFLSNGDRFFEHQDPRESAQHKVEYGGDLNVNLNEGCWVVHVIESDEDYDIVLSETDGETLGEEITKSCKADYTAQSSDGTEFTKIGAYKIVGDTQIEVSITCDTDSDCSDIVVFLNDDYKTTMGLFSELPILISVAMCCLGFLLIPVGWILIVINRSRVAQVQLAQQQMIQTMEPSDEEIPYADSQQMLTTDQIYQMMRGNLPDESGQKNIPPPFVDVKEVTPVVQRKETGGSANKTSSHTSEKLPADDSWRKWDEA
jgi:uncharacterized membrane protein